MGWALAAVSIGSSVANGISAHKQGKAAQAAGDAQMAFMQQQAARREQLLAGLLAEGAFEFTPVDPVKSARRALDYTTSVIPQLNKNAATINTASARSFEDVMRIAMGEQPGGGNAFDTHRSAANQVVMDQLSGNLSQGTMKLMGRMTLGSHATSLGAGAVQQLYTGYLGITAEQQAQAGIGNYQNLVNTYRNGIPLVTATQLMPYGGLSTAESIQTDQFNSTGMFQAGVSRANAILGGFDTGTRLMGQGMAAQGQGNMAMAQAQGQVIQSIAQGVGALGGMYHSYANNPSLQGSGGPSFGQWMSSPGSYGYGTSGYGGVPPRSAWSYGNTQQRYT